MRRIAIIADNSVYYLKKIIQIWNSNNCAVLIDRRIPKKKIIELIRLADVIFCYTDDIEVANAIDEVGITTSFFDEINKDIETVSSDIYLNYKQRYDTNEALIIFSSGTTGDNKGIVLAHRTITENAELSVKYKKLDENSLVYIYKSMAHSSTIINECLACMISKSKMIIASTNLTIRGHFKRIDENRITVVSFNPQLIRFIIKNKVNKIYKFDSLKLIISSGAVLSDFIHKKATEILNVKIINGYGLTEAGPLLTIQSPERDIIYGSVGKPVQNVSIEIRDDNGNVQPFNKPGVIFAKTKMKMSYYINKINPYHDGWIDTKDIGYIKENGELFVLGRHDNMIISGTHNIHPETIEKIVLDIDDVKECIVYGEEDETYGMIIICKCVVNNDNHSKIRKKIFRYCKDNLASFEVPHKILFVNTINNTYSGKIQRKGE